MKLHDEPTMLDILYDHYIGSGNDIPQIRQCRKELHQLLQQMPFEQQDAICCQMNHIQSLRERCAFLTGVQSGAQLTLELLTEQ